MRDQQKSTEIDRIQQKSTTVQRLFHSIGPHQQVRGNDDRSTGEHGQLVEGQHPYGEEIGRGGVSLGLEGERERGQGGLRSMANRVGHSVKLQSQNLICWWWV